MDKRSSTSICLLKEPYATFNAKRKSQIWTMAYFLWSEAYDKIRELPECLED